MYYKKPKYMAVKTVVDGETFDSKKEARRYQELKMLEQCGEIFDLCRQVKFELIPTQKIHGKTERSCSYIADFVYKKRTPDGAETIVEDTKGFKTAEYIIKRKLMLYLKGIEICEI